MRTAKISNSRSQQTVSAKTVSSPVGGWNTRDPISEMPETDALILENFICRTTKVETRKGLLDYLTGLATTVESLLVYRSPLLQKMFACSSAGIFDASVGGAFAAALVALTNGQLEYVNFSTAGGSYLLAVNGTDPMKSYNGTIWSDAAITGAGITGFTTSIFNNISQFKHRIFLTAKGSSSFFYLPIDAVAGAVTEFPMGQLFSKGGFLQSCLNWTIDGGSGADDYCLFLTSEGECAVYKGTDPASAATWALQGIFVLPKPIGKKCMMKYGGDVLILTESGVYPISKALQSSSIDRRIAITDKIVGAFSIAANAYFTIHGWEAFLYSKEDLLIFNIPTSLGASAEQYVMNTLTGSWSKLTGIPATCFAVFNNLMYYGMAGKVGQALVGVSDNGAIIASTAQQAYNYFGSRGALKHVDLVRPILEAAGAYALGLAVVVDYKIAINPVAVAETGNISAAKFDTSVFDTATWGFDTTTETSWRTVASEEGTALSFLMTVASNRTTVAWDVTDFAFSRGALLG